MSMTYLFLYSAGKFTQCYVFICIFWCSAFVWTSYIGFTWVSIKVCWIYVVVDCWRVVWQSTDMHCASLGLQQAVFCCTSHEHSYVEQSFHRAASDRHWWAWHFSHSTCYKEVSLWGLWQWCHGWTLYHLLNCKTLLWVKGSAR